MNSATCLFCGFRRVVRFELLLALLISAGSLGATELVVERTGNPNRYSTEDEKGEFAFFDLNEGIQVQVIRAFMNGFDGETATFSIDGPYYNPEAGVRDPNANPLFFSHSLLLQEVRNASAKWQGIHSLKWDLPAGTYKITIEGGDLPYAYGGPPSSIDNEPGGYTVEQYDGGTHLAGGPFGLQIYGAPLSAVPEPATYGLMGGLALFLTIAIRRRSRLAGA